MSASLPKETLAALFTEARTHGAWRDEPVDDAMLERLYELVCMAPTSANCSPGRFVFVRTPEGKQRLAASLSRGNLDKTMGAPVTVIVAHDSAFHDHLPTLFPHTDARSWFTGSPEKAAETAFRNGTLQAGYLIIAARSLGLDCGPMSGFDAKKLDEAFFTGTNWKSNFLINLGHGDASALRARLPRLPFDTACRWA